jgi:tetratricopeptide (TPR) repeat protein
MNEKYIHIIGILLTAAGFILISFLYLTEPRSLAEVATKGQVAIGAYEVNKAEFERGLESFRKGEYSAARAAFDRADPEKRDAATQYYVSYSFYRQGWGRVYNDDALFRPGLETVNRVIALNPDFRSPDETLGMKTPAELKNELEEGLKITPSDFNPMKLTRQRK